MSPQNSPVLDAPNESGAAAARGHHGALRLAHLGVARHLPDRKGGRRPANGSAVGPRAIQDPWIVPPPGPGRLAASNRNVYGTTLRSYDSASRPGTVHGLLAASLAGFSLLDAASSQRRRVAG